MVQGTMAKMPAPANCRIKIESLHEFGLLCHPDEDLAAFSLDAMADVIEETLEGNSNYVALVEMKSKCSEVTLTHDMEVVGEFGEYQEINIDDNPQLFKGSIPDASYRCQLLHGIASGSVNHAVYVVASLRKIICVVHVHKGALQREQYLSVIATLGRQHLHWITEGVVPARITFKAGSHAVDHHSVQCNFALWKALCNVLEEQEWQQHLVGCHLIPEVVATWSRGQRLY